MLYIAYLPKTKGEHITERKVNRILKWYTNLTGNKYSIIASPGYFSTTNSSIDLYLRELSGVLTAGFNRRIGFLNGMNGHHNTISGSTIIDEHNKKLGLYNFNQIVLNPKREFDHRKMMCFFAEKGEPYSEITLDNLESFLNDVYVGAILIGSSNQSKTTYFDDFAKKGEADIFMFDVTEDLYCEHKIEQMLFENANDNDVLSYNDDIVITKSFFGKGHIYSQEFLKNILRETLINGLDK